MPSHHQTYYSNFTIQQLFDVVADVSSYPEFLPWIKGARIHSHCDNVMQAELLIAFKMFRGSYVSQVTLCPLTAKKQAKIDVALVRGPFKTLTNQWLFSALDDGRVKIEFFVEFEFKSRMLDKMLRVVFDRAVMQMMQAFQHRAEVLYGG